jgi:endonuclease YncB( thermonuclease family)
MARKRKSILRTTRRPLVHGWVLFGLVFVGGLTWAVHHPSVGVHTVAPAWAPAARSFTLGLIKDGPYDVPTRERLNSGAIGGYAEVLAGDQLRVDGRHFQLAGIRTTRGVGYCHPGNPYGWECGTTASEALRGLIGQLAVSCWPQGRYRGELELAKCETTGVGDLAYVLVREGLATTVEAEGPNYGLAQSMAQSSRVGVWAHH